MRVNYKISNGAVSKLHGYPKLPEYKITKSTDMSRTLKASSARRLLEKLQEAKLQFGREAGAGTLKLLAAAGSTRFRDAASLIRFHELLLFIRVYPQNPQVARKADELLAGFAQRVAELGGKDAELFDEEESAGIAGTAIDATFSYEIVRWLAQAHCGELEIDWDGYEHWDRVGATLPRLLPLLEEDALVEANVPYLDWLKAALGKAGNQLSWLLRGFEGLQCSPQEKAELFGALELLVRWELKDSAASRTHMRRPAGEIYYHSGPLLRRSDVSLETEMNAEPLPLEKLSLRDGQAVLDMTRDASAVRYRELYGFTHGDPAQVWRADAGRGLQMLVFGVPPERRLPLRAYHAGFFCKNGVPIGYVETLTLFERIEVGFNLYYTFRDGESAWLYAQMLRLFRQFLGVSCVSVDPYQIGFHNREAIDSGAFWFYRKLGFRPVRADLARLAAAEEKRIKSHPGHRTSERTLRRLAEGSMIYEEPGSSRGDWDRFLARHLGLAVQRRMAEHFDGDAKKFRQAAVTETGEALGMNAPRPGNPERKSFENFALVLSLISGLGDWPDKDKQQIVDVVEAKMAKEDGLPESEYVRALQAASRLRSELIRLGSVNHLPS